MAWIPLLKAGSWTDRHNSTYKFTNEHLKGIAKNYDSAKKEASLVVGHPDRSAVPSFGAVEALKVVGDTLFFRPAGVVAEFAALVKQRKFPHVSAGLTLIKDMAGQVSYALDHVAFLSAQDPGVLGLDEVTSLEFSLPSAEVVSLDVTAAAADITEGRAEFSQSLLVDWIGFRFRALRDAMRAFRENLIEDSGLEKADKIVPAYVIDSLGVDPPTESGNVAFSKNKAKGESMDFEKLFNEEREKNRALETEKVELSKAASAFEAENKKLKGEVDVLKPKVAELEEKNTRAEFGAYVEKLISGRKVLPDRKDAVVDLLMQFRELSQKPEFAKGEKETPLDKYKNELEAGPAVAPESGADERKGPEFSGGADAAVIGLKARSYIAEQAAKGITVSAMDAVAKVKSQ